MSKIKRAILSVYNKDGIVPLAKFLVASGVEVLSTGGTAKLLKDNKVSVRDISDYTGFPEMMDGRVKTLHPKVHGGLLAMRENAEHKGAMEKNGIEPIDMVVVNLYPFEETVAKPDCTLEDAIENIDIGGPAMLRSAAKNYPYVTVVTEPEDYELIISEMKGSGGEVSSETNFGLAKKVFALTARYDGAISTHLNAINKEGVVEEFSDIFNYQAIKVQDLRYGENPHQRGAFYRERHLREPSVANAEQIHGKELSYNNILDLDSVLGVVREFEEVAAAIVKHNNPCGVAISKKSLHDAFVNARECDPQSAFGGVIAFTKKVDKATAEEINQHFYEAVIAPDFEDKALEILKGKKNIRLLRIYFKTPSPLLSAEALAEEDAGEGKGEGEIGLSFRKVVGGLLVQTLDLDQNPISAAKVVTKRAPTEDELKGLEFGWKVVKHVKSNAIVIASGDRTLGIGAGQMSRIDSVKIAVMKMKNPPVPPFSKGGVGGLRVMASDAFFPFRDCIDEAAKHGITAIIQPGGSLRDQESIDAANEHGMAMVVTGVRHFRH